jgi:hypothetical protein
MTTAFLRAKIKAGGLEFLKLSLYSFPQVAEDMAQYVPSNKLDLILAACEDEDSPHRSVDGVKPRSQTSLFTTKPVQIL